MRLLLLCLGLAACGTLNAARPLSQGQSAVGLTFGGPLVNLGAPIPLPSLVVEGRHGLAPLAGRPFDVHYGLNLTGAAFGLAGVHGGAGWQVLEQAGGRPALTVVDRLFLVDNHLDRTKDDPALWALNQTELLASWQWGRPMVYTGLSEVLDLRAPGLMLAPILGGELPLGAARRVSLQVELRYQGVNRLPESEAIPWVSLGPGALQTTVGAQVRLGKEERP
jgi:hypothetical protein